MLFRSYPKLVQNGLLSPVDIPPLQPPYPRWYNENVHCDYHSGNRGHSTENCTSLKRKVQDLINKGELTFEDEDISDVNRNPLPNHGGPKINAIERSEEIQVKRSIKDVCMPMRLVHKVLVKAGRLGGCLKKEDEVKDQGKHFCQYHGSATGHAIQECLDFLELVQKMMNE